MATVRGLSLNGGKLDVQLHSDVFKRDGEGVITLNVGSGLTTDPERGGLCLNLPAAGAGIGILDGEFVITADNSLKIDEKGLLGVSLHDDSLEVHNSDDGTPGLSVKVGPGLLCIDGVGLVPLCSNGISISDGGTISPDAGILAPNPGLKWDNGIKLGSFDVRTSMGPDIKAQDKAFFVQGSTICFKIGSCLQLDSMGFLTVNIEELIEKLANY